MPDLADENSQKVLGEACCPLRWVITSQGCHIREACLSCFLSAAAVAAVRFEPLCPVRLVMLHARFGTCQIGPNRARPEVFGRMTRAYGAGIFLLRLIPAEEALCWNYFGHCSSLEQRYIDHVSRPLS